MVPPAAASSRLLAQVPASPAPVSPPTTGSSIRAVIWVGILIGVIVLAVLLIKNLRARIMSSHAPAMTRVGGLEHLRQLRASGQITQEEFEVARARLISKFSARLNAPSTPPSSPEPTPPPRDGLA